MSVITRVTEVQPPISSKKDDSRVYKDGKWYPLHLRTRLYEGGFHEERGPLEASSAAYSKIDALRSQQAWEAQHFKGFDVDSWKPSSTALRSNIFQYFVGDCRLCRVIVDLPQRQMDCFAALAKTCSFAIIIQKAIWKQETTAIEAISLAPKMTWLEDRKQEKR